MFYKHGVILSIVVLIFSVVVFGNSLPSVSNISAIVQDDGSGLVEITYDLYDADSDFSTVGIAVSNDGGKSYRLPAKSFTGHVGENVRPGRNRKVLWDAATDTPVELTDLKAFVYADDNRGPAPMVLVGAGWFPYQNTSNPERKVFVPAFLMDKYEVTNDFYCKFLNEADPKAEHWAEGMEIERRGKAGSYSYTVKPGRERYPVIYVNYYDAMAFAKWRSKIDGQVYNLPTEQQWEKAAAWDPVKQRFYQFATQSDSISYDTCNFGSAVKANNLSYDYAGSLAEVGYFEDNITYKGNGQYKTVDAKSYFGCYDMSGNVWEWMRDPAGVIRGGSWCWLGFGEDECRTTHRHPFIPEYRYERAGFRLMREIEPGKTKVKYPANPKKTEKRKINLTPYPAKAVQGEAFDVGDRAQLFIDKVLVEKADNVKFTLHQGTKHPENPLVVADKPWEGYITNIYGQVLYDEQDKIFKMWYLAGGDKFSEYGFGNVTCYATSKDGIHWQKPLVGTLPAKNDKGHNAVCYAHISSVIKDLEDKDPARRYKMLAYYTRPYGYHTLISPDGLNWQQISPVPIAQQSDVMTAFYDHRRGLYVAYVKHGSRIWRGFKRRMFYITTSEDFVNWTPTKLALAPDELDDSTTLARLEKVKSIFDKPTEQDFARTEFYGNAFYPTESCTVAFPWLFRISSPRRTGVNQEGICDIQLAVSRDLENWSRLFRDPVVPLGSLGSWDSAFLCSASTVIRVDDEIRLYYTGSNMPHRGACPDNKADYCRDPETNQQYDCFLQYKQGIGLVTWPLDRFVSVDAGSNGGSLTTIPIKFTGKYLELNAATKSTGSIVVEILDEKGKAIKDFEKSDAFTGDEIRTVITFNSKKSIEKLSGKTIQLRFNLKDAQLYSFAFRR